METRSLDSRPAKEKENDERELDLLQPREHKQKRKDNQREEVQKEVHGKGKVMQNCRMMN